MGCLKKALVDRLCVKIRTQIMYMDPTKEYETHVHLHNSRHICVYVDVFRYRSMQSVYVALLRQLNSY